MGEDSGVIEVLDWTVCPVGCNGVGQASFAYGPSGAAHKRSQSPGHAKEPIEERGWFLDGLFSVHAGFGTRPDWIPK